MSEDEKPDDARLRAAMQALREDDTRKAPTFEAVRAKPSRPRALRAIYPVAGAVAMAAGVFALYLQSQRADAPSMASAPVAAASATSMPAVATSAAPAEPAAPVARFSRDDVAPLDFLLEAPSHAFAAGAGPASLDFLVPPETSR